MAILYSLYAMFGVNILRENIFFPPMLVMLHDFGKLLTFEFTLSGGEESWCNNKANKVSGCQSP